MPSLLYRQLFKELLTLFTLCTASLLSLLVIGRMLQLREMLFSQGVGLTDIALLFLYMVPFFLLLLLPVACMLSAFLTVLRMAAENETVALRASGVSLYQMLPAPCTFFLLCTVVSFLLSFYGLSWGMENFRATVLEIAQSRSRLIIQPGVFSTEIPQMTFFAQQADRQTDTLRTIMIQDSTRKNIDITIIAPEGKIQTNAEQGTLFFLLKNGTIYRQQENSLEVLGFEEYLVRVDLSRLLSGFSLGEILPEEMSWSALVALKQQLNSGNPEGLPKHIKDPVRYTNRIQTELQKRLVLPVSCIVLGLFALPVATGFRGVGRQWGVLLPLAFFMVYYSMLSLGISLGEAGTVPPEYGLWIPNVLFSFIGIAGIRHAVRERLPSVSHVLYPVQTGYTSVKQQVRKICSALLPDQPAKNKPHEKN